MANITCEIIRDLLPLYVDGVLSDDSRELVEEHLEHCEACKAFCQNLTEDDLPELQIRHADDKAALQKIRRKIDIKRLRSVCLAVILVAAAAAGIFYAVVVKESYLSYEDSGLYVEDNTLKTGVNYHCCYEFSAPGSESGFIYLSTTVCQNLRTDSQVIEIEHLNEEVVTSLVTDDDGNVVEEWHLKELYYVPEEYAKKLDAQKYWVMEGVTEQEMKEKDEELLAELKGVSELVWSADEKNR